MANSVVIRHGKQSTNNEYLKRFPPFLWLLRDTLVKMPEKDGKELTPTEYLTTEVLGGENPDSMEMAVRRALTQLFPRFECKTLPPPSTDVNVMVNITKNKDQLTSLFNQGVDELIAFMKVTVKPKKVFSSAGATCDGRTLAVLVQEVAKAVNDPNSIPALDNTWKLVVQSRCRDVQEKLIAEYCTTIKTRYDSASKGGPLEEEFESGQEQCASVIGIHNKLWAEIKEMLCNEIEPLFSISVSEECTLESVTRQLENQLVQFQWENIPHTENRVKRVIGGALYATVEENRKRSREYCNKLFNHLYAEIRKQVEKAEEGYTAETLEDDIENLWQEYNSKSVGPEKMYIRDRMERQIEENKGMLQDQLQRAQDRKAVKELFKKIDTNLEEQKKDFEKRLQEEKERREKAEKRLEETQDRLTKETLKYTEERHNREKAEERHRVTEERLDEEKQRAKEEKERADKVTEERNTLKEQLLDVTHMKDRAEEKLEEETQRHTHLIKDKDIEITKQIAMVDETKKELDKQAKENEEHQKKAQQLRTEIEKKKKIADGLNKTINDKTTEADELNKAIKDKLTEIEALTADIQNKKKDMEKKIEYIESFENSKWYRRMTWSKRHDQQ